MTEYEEDYYGILGVEESASPDEIRKAYLRLAKKLHPDRFPNDEQGKVAAQAEFRRVTQAHYVVGDAERREEYDRLRQLAKSRMALRTGEPGQAAPVAGQDLAATQVDIQAQEGINQKWAAKHLARADELFRRRRFHEAETAIKEAIRLVPSECKYHNKLAEIYLARGWRTYAMTEVQAALRIDPKDPDAKNLETKIKALAREAGPAGKGNKKSFFEQLKEILTRKL